MSTASVVAWLALRFGVAGVYLYALFRNVRDENARTWTRTHTALLLDLDPEKAPAKIVLLLAWSGMLAMAIGGVSILLGLEGRAGALLLAAFTAGGIYQHHRECLRAGRVAEGVLPTLPAAAAPAITELQWSAFAGNLSSGLKNYALVGVCIWIAIEGTGPLSLSDSIGGLLHAPAN